MKLRYPDYPLVMIEWRDHASAEVWENVEQAKADFKPHLLKTVGWLIGETDEAYNLVMNLATDGDVTMRMIILKGTVKRFKVLRKHG